MRPPWWARLPRPWLTALTAAAAGGAFVAGPLTAGVHGWARALLLTLGVGLAAAGVVLGNADRRRTERARRTAEQVAIDAETSLTLTVNAALAPLTRYLGELAVAADTVDREQLTGQVRQAVVQATVTVTTARARAALYSLAPDERSLNLEAYAGRSEQPRERFLAGTGDGDFVLDLVRRGDLLIVDDVSSHPLVKPSTPGYRCVVAAAITAGPVSLGMLTVDAPDVGALTHTHSELVRVLANLLGAALARG